MDIKSGSSSPGRATASQAVGSGFESRLPLRLVGSPDSYRGLSLKTNIMKAKQSFWKNYSVKGALFLGLLFFVVTVISDKLSEGKSWNEVFTSVNFIIVAISSLLGGFIMEYVFVAWGKKSAK